MSESKFNLPTLMAAILISVVLSVAISYSVISRETGPSGPEGPQWEQGIQGIQGSQGLQGPTGEPGISGELGPQGDRGPVGYYATYYPIGEYVEVPGIVNGDFTDGKEGWYYQGKGGFGPTALLYQHPSGTFMMQSIEVKQNYGLAFMVEPHGARLEIHCEGEVLFYGDFREESSDLIEVVISFGSLVGRHDLYFYVLPGKDDGSYIAVDDVTMVEFTTN